MAVNCTGVVDVNGNDIFDSFKTTIPNVTGLQSALADKCFSHVYDVDSDHPLNLDTISADTMALLALTNEGTTTFLSNLVSSQSQKTINFYNNTGSTTITQNYSAYIIVHATANDFNIIYFGNM